MDYWEAHQVIILMELNVNNPAWTDYNGDAPLPVVLSTFTVVFADTSPLLLWTTMSESANLGWNIYRSETPYIGNSVVLNYELIEGAGTTSNPTDYSYYDENPTESGITYWYWLETVNYTGETELHGSVTLTVPGNEEEQETPATPETYGLYSNYPNPFNPNTDISFALPVATTGELVIYNMKGQKIKTLFTGEIEAEQIYNFTWNGTDDNGQDVTSGIYFYQLKSGTESHLNKMIMMK